MDDIKNTQNKQEAKKEEEEQQGKKYDPTLLCNYCLLNQLKDVKRCQFLSSKSKDPQTFVEAMHDNNTELMNGLINHGFDINSTYGSKIQNTMLIIAAMNGLGDAFQLLLNFKADAYVLNSSGVGCLHYACARGHVQILEALSESDVTLDLSHKDTYHESTPAMWAAERGRKKILKYIYENFDKKYLLEYDNYRRTCSHYAALRGSNESLSYLNKVKCLQHDFEDNEGRTPYALAKAYNHEKTVELLTKTCPHPYLEEDSICGVCGMDKYDFGVI